MKYKLIMLPNPILVSDEEKQIFDRVWNSDVEKILRVSEVFMPHGNKIIAGIEGLPKLDLSVIAEEIGWVDVEKLAEENADSFVWDFESPEGNGYIDHVEGFKEGFKVAQSLNEKKFSEEDLRKAIEWANNGGGSSLSESANTFIKSLSQPKVFDVEVEMERTRYPKGEDGWEDIYVPKITNNTIKVTKILN